jgi:two-component system sensor histidine kinase KdpD
MTPTRPDPDALLRLAEQENTGRLKVFLGAAPGVGKTCEMLDDALGQVRAGVDVVVGIAETHGRRETEARLRPLSVLPRMEVAHRGHTLLEMDLDAILERKPALVLVDELAHANAPGCRHDKRWQDVEEILAAGIDVWSTLNIQHLESLNDVVASFTHVRVRETVPDRLLDRAEIEVVDTPPDELIERLRAGQVYVPQEAARALHHFFSRSNLSALRELVLRRAAQAVDAQMLDDVRAQALAGTWATADRVLVAVGSHDAASDVVRAGRRIADALRAPWTAVHIETAGERGTQANARLAEAMHLATQLGGQILATPAAGVVEGLAQAAADTRATLLVVGAPRPRRFAWQRRLTVDVLARRLPDLALQQVPVAHRPVAGSVRLPQADWRRVVSGLVPGLGATALVTALGRLLFAAAPITNVALLYFLPVMLAATRYGLASGVLTGLAASLAYNFFFIPPTGTFTISDPQNIITVLVLVAVAAVSSQLAARLRQQALLAGASARTSAALAGFARMLTGVTSAEELGRVLCAEAARLLDAHAVLLLPVDGVLDVAAAYPPENRLEVLDMAAARWAFDRGQPAGRGSGTLTASEWLFTPLAAGGAPLAVLGLARGDAAAPVRSDRLPLLGSLVDQAGLALERIRLEHDMAGVRQLEERDRLRAALLSSISHDLRTPLTAVVGTLRELTPANADQAPILATARAEADRLQRFIANLLDMVRIEAGAIALRPEAVDLAEAVASAVHDLRRTLAGRNVAMDIAPDLPLVTVDPRLFHHCLINLIENAVRHGGAQGAITILARRRPDGLDLVVMDEGPGLPPGMEIRVFEIFTRVEGSDRKGGTGLGLAIVKGFARAMGIEASAANRSDRTGACFTLHFDETLLRKIGVE